MISVIELSASSKKLVDIKILDTLVVSCACLQHTKVGWLTNYLPFHLKSRRSIDGCLNTMWNFLWTEKPNTCTVIFSPGYIGAFTYGFRRLFKTQGESKVILGFTFPFSNLQIQEGILWNVQIIGKGVRVSKNLPDQG